MSGIVPSLLAAGGLVVALSASQMRWTDVDPIRMRRVPAVLAAVAVVLPLQAPEALELTPTSLTLAAAEIVVALTTGALTARVTQFRLAEARTGSTAAPVVVQARTGWLGAGLLILALLVHVIVAAVSRSTQSELVETTGFLLATLAANRALRAWAVARRWRRRGDGGESTPR